MKPPLNRKVYVVGYDAATALGNTFDNHLAAGRARRGRFSPADPLPGRLPAATWWARFPTGIPGAWTSSTARSAHIWNADFVFLTMELCQQALAHAGLIMDAHTAPRTACLIGSALNGTDAYRIAMDNYSQQGPTQGQPLSAAQPVRQPAGGQGRHAARLHRADLFAPGRLRLGQSRHRASGRG